MMAAPGHRKSRLNLFFCPEYRPIVYFYHTSIHTGLMHCCIHQVLRCAKTCFLRSTAFSCWMRQILLSEGLKNCLPVRLVFVAGNQPRRFELQAVSRFLYQLFCICFRAFAVDHFQHKFVFGIKGNVIPIVTASGIRRIVFVAMFLFFPNEVPLLVELNLFRVRGTVLLKMGQQVRREVVRHVLRQVVCNDLRYRDQLSPNVLFFAFHSPRRRVREWKRRFSPAIASRKKPCRDVRKSVVYKSSNTTAACCLGRNRHERGYFLHPEHHVGSSFYSDNKTCQDRP